MKSRFLVLIIVIGLAVCGSGPLPAALAQATADPSPRGKIAFSSDRSGHSEVYVMDADGSNVQQLTHDAAHMSYGPSWSPDGKHLVYSTKLENGMSTYLSNADGSQPIKIGDNLLNTHRFMFWSPDSQHFSFGRFLALPEPGTNTPVKLGFYIMNSDGGGLKEIDNAKQDIERIEFLPDGHLLISTYHDLYRADADGTNRQSLVTATEYLAALSPDYSQIVATRNLDIVVFDVNGANAHKIAPFKRNQVPANIGWSPDAKYIWIVFQTIAEATADLGTQEPTALPLPTSYPQIFVMNADGSDYHQIPADDNTISWSPDSQYITYTARDGDKYQVFTSQPDGTGRQKITQEGNNSQPAWQPIAVNP